MTETDIDLKALKASAKLGEVEAMYSLAVAHQDLAEIEDSGSNKKEAKKWFEKAAQLDHVASMVALGHIHTYELEYKKAIKWYSKASSLGDEKSFLFVAQSYEALGDTKSVRKWLEIGAQGNDADAMFLLYGLLHKLGNESDEASKWLDKAAKLNHGGAVRTLGLQCLAAGDKAGAIGHFDRALSLGNEEAKLDMARATNAITYDIEKLVGIEVLQRLQVYLQLNLDTLINDLEEEESETGEERDDFSSGYIASLKFSISQIGYVIDGTTELK